MYRNVPDHLCSFPQPYVQCTDLYSTYNIYFICLLIFYLFRVITEELKQYSSDELREMARQVMLEARIDFLNEVLVSPDLSKKLCWKDNLPKLSP